MTNLFLGRSSSGTSAPPLPSDVPTHGKLGEPPCYPMAPPPMQYPHHASSPEMDAATRSPGSPQTPASPTGPDDLSVPKRAEIDVVTNNNNEGEGSMGVSRVEGSG